MHEFNKLLVVINTASEDQPALEKAALIAGNNGKVTALLPAAKLSTEQLESIQTKLQGLKDLGLDVDLEQSDEKDVLRALLVCQHGRRFDLTIKEPQPTSLAGSLFTPLDWKLLRSSRNPVLMVRPGKKPAGAPILAAIEAQPSDSEHQALSQQILALSKDLSQRLARPLHLFSAAPAPMQNPGHAEAEQQLDAYRDACLTLAASQGITADQVHVAQGPAEVLIPEHSANLDAALLVLGTVARSGLSGVLLGNTAEQILERVDTHVLVVPPTQTA